MTHADRFVAFAFSHQTLIIEGIFATILAIIVVWLFANLQQENEEEKPSNSQEIEALLKRVLATAPNASGPLVEKIPTKEGTPVPGAGVVSTNQPSFALSGNTPAKTETGMMASVSAPSPTGTTAPPPVIETPGSTQIVEARDANIAKEGGGEDLSKLRDTLENRNQKVDALEKQLEAAKEELKKAYENKPSGSDMMDELKKQITVLEGRLHEYSIIEDDIANLSSYKDENIRLKEELEKLKRKAGGAQTMDYAKAPPPQIPVVESPATAEVSALEEPVDEEPEPTAIASPEAGIPDPPVNLPPKAGNGPVWPINENETKKLMQEFDSLMSTQTPAAAVTEIIDHSNAKEGEKLIADFQNYMKGTS